MSSLEELQRYVADASKELTRYRKLAEDRPALLERIEQLEQANSSLTDEVADLKQQVLVSRGRHGGVARALALKTSEVDELSQINRSLSEENADLREALLQADEILRDREDQYESLQRKLKQIERSHQTATLLCAELAKRPVALEATERELHRAAIDINRLRNEKNQLLSDLNAAQDALKAARGEQQGSLETLKLDIRRLSRKNAALVADREDLSARLIMTQADVTNLKAEIERYRRALTEHAGRSASPSRTG